MLQKYKKQRTDFKSTIEFPNCQIFVENDGFKYVFAIVNMNILMIYGKRPAKGQDISFNCSELHFIITQVL